MKLLRTFLLVGAFLHADAQEETTAIMPDDVEDFTGEFTGEYTDTTTSTTTTTTIITTTTVAITTPTTTKATTTSTTTEAPVTASVTTTTPAPVTTTTLAPVSTTSVAPVTESSIAVSTTTVVIVDPNDAVETTEAQPVVRPVIIDGELETAFNWDDELADKNSEAYKEKRDILENDLKVILEEDENIESAELTECTFTEAGAEVVTTTEANVETEPQLPDEVIAADPETRRRRQVSEAVNKAQADFKVKVTAKSREVAEVAATKTITKANPDTFPSLSENSAKTYSQVVTYADPIAVTIPASATASSEKLRIAVSIMGVLAVLIL